MPNPDPWSTLTPKDVATLLFVRRGLELLLIRKRRGLGAGKINAPGGRLEPGETPEEAAIREVQEEVGVRPLGARHRGELRFIFTDGYTLLCHVFLADGCEGEPVETAEALPLWVPIDAVPYAEMWADDALWLPRMLAGWTFRGRFVFDGDRMVEAALDLDDPGQPVWDLARRLALSMDTHQHPPVFTVTQARAVRQEMGGVHTKNLFLRDKKGRQWLVVLPEEQEADLRLIGDRLGARRLSFGSPARLREALGVEAGSVSPLAAAFDRAGSVTVALDPRVWDAAQVHAHPMTNDRTTALSGADLLRFLRASGHEPVRL
jgi:8-oxo-dGTP diphosphatase